MARIWAAVARRLDVGGAPVKAGVGQCYRRGLRLAVPEGAALRGPDKYLILERRRRRAQIRARRLLDIS